MGLYGWCWGHLGFLIREKTSRRNTKPPRRSRGGFVLCVYIYLAKNKKPGSEQIQMHLARVVWGTHSQRPVKTTRTSSRSVPEVNRSARRTLGCDSPRLWVCHTRSKSCHSFSTVRWVSHRALAPRGTTTSTLLFGASFSVSREVDLTSWALGLMITFRLMALPLPAVKTSPSVKCTVGVGGTSALAGAVALSPDGC